MANKEAFEFETIAELVCKGSEKYRNYPNHADRNSWFLKKTMARFDLTGAPRDNMMIFLPGGNDMALVTELQGLRYTIISPHEGKKMTLTKTNSRNPDVLPVDCYVGSISAKDQKNIDNALIGLLAVQREELLEKQEDKPSDLALYSDITKPLVRNYGFKF